MGAPVAVGVGRGKGHDGEDRRERLVACKFHVRIQGAARVAV
jgi:hypothetical protein